MKTVRQFGVYRNTSPRTGRTHPYLVVVQSDRWPMNDRLVVPLIPRAFFALDDIPRIVLTPTFEIEGRQVFVNPFELTPVPISRLGEEVASLAHDEDARRRIQKALDEAMSPY